MPWPVHPNGLLGAQGDNDTYRIERSLRFNSDDLAYLGRTFGTPTSQNIWTFSCWAKRSKFGVIGNFISSDISNTQFYFNTDDTLNFFIGVNRFTTTQVFRDTSAWFHLVLACSTSASGSNKIKLYINGSEITSFSSDARSGYIGSDINKASTGVAIGRYGLGANNYFDGYLTETYFIDGQQLTPSSFGETDPITGRWKAKAYSGTYGTNGFYLKFADNNGTTATTLGKDSSGNGNNWTPNNFSVDNTTSNGIGNDSLVESPTNYGTDTGLGGEVRGNYCTFNPLKRSSTYANLSNGNLTIAGTTGGAGQQSVQGSIAISSGKWYAEAIITTVGAESSVGIARATQNTGFYVGSGAFSYGYYLNGQKYNNSSASAYGASYTSGDVIGVAFDADAGTLVFYKNGTSQGTAFTGLTSGPYVFEGQGRSATSGNQNDWNFGQRPWKYTAPTGFKALCTTNLTTPTIKKPSSYFDAVTYTGTGSALTPTSSLGFSPDLVWLKSRSAATDHALYDTVRGAEKRLESNTTDAEVTSDSGVTAFNSNGFTLGTLAQANTNTATYVAWAWDEATIAGLDIVGYVGDGNSGRTISHNLGVTPKMIIVKNRTTVSDWPVYHSSLAANNIVFLHLTQAQAAISTLAWGGVSAASSTTFTATVGNVDIRNVNKSGDNYIAYCFAEIEGYSKFGSYAGNGSADGPFVYCGFRPRWILTKNISSGAAGYDWMIWDTSRDSFNEATKVLSPNLSNAEYATSIDAVSSGFKLRNSGATANENGSTHIFAAFAESPFKYARAR